MPTIAESQSTQSQLRAGLDEGVTTLSQNQTVKFTRYERKVLPADGFIFWLRTPKSVEFQGSLHYASQLQQREDETIAVNQVVFTSLSEIRELNDTAPDTIWIATVNNIRFSFGARENYYKQADLYHYRGAAIYSAMYSQIIESPADLDLTNTVLSNSLPLWLTLNQIIPVYPAFLVPDNLHPPYAAIDVSSTRALQAVPVFKPNLSHWQLAADHVKVTIYGLRNNSALDYQDYVLKYMSETENLGLMNTPIIRDEKRGQVELSIIAMKKSIEFDVSYYQNRVNSVSRQFILDAFAQYFVNPL